MARTTFIGRVPFRARPGAFSASRDAQITRRRRCRGVSTPPSTTLASNRLSSIRPARSMPTNAAALDAAAVIREAPGGSAPTREQSHLLFHEPAVREITVINCASLTSALSQSLKQDEPVEYVIEKSEPDGRMKAIEVTGPEGACVQGAPRRMTYSRGGRGGGRGRGRKGKADGEEGGEPADATPAAEAA